VKITSYQLKTDDMFKSSRIDRIYELNALERHHNVVNTSGELGIFSKPWSFSKPRGVGVSLRSMAKYHNYYAVILSRFSYLQRS